MEPLPAHHLATAATAVILIISYMPDDRQKGSGKQQRPARGVGGWWCIWGSVWQSPCVGCWAVVSVSVPGRSRAVVTSRAPLRALVREYRQWCTVQGVHVLRASLVCRDHRCHWCAVWGIEKTNQKK